MPPVVPPTRDSRLFCPLTEDHINRIYTRYRDGGVRDDDIALVKAFITEKRAKRSVTQHYIKTVVYALLNWALYCPVPFREAGIGDIYVASLHIDEAKKPGGSPRYGQSYRHAHRRHLNRFSGGCAGAPSINPSHPTTSRRSPDRVRTRCRSRSRTS